MRKVVLPIVFTVMMMLGPMAMSSQMCSDLFSVTQKSLYDRYLEISEKVKNHKQLIIQSIPLLREAFKPIVDDLKMVVDKYSDHELRAIARITERDIPIFEGIFSEKGARVPHIVRDPPKPFDAQYLIQGNASSFAKNYALENSPDVLVASRHFYGFPDNVAVRKMGLLQQQFGAAVTPIGAYGSQFAKMSFRTTQILMEIAVDKLQGSSAVIQKKNPLLIKQRTARGRGAEREQGHPSLAPLSATIEGILSVHQLINELLIEKIDGIENGSDALEAIVKSGETPAGLISELTLQLPIGFVGPASLSGYGFRKPLKLDSNGKVRLSENFKTFLQSVREKAKEKGLIKGACPMAGIISRLTPSGERQKSGIQITAELYLRVFRQVEAEEKSKGQ